MHVLWLHEHFIKLYVHQHELDKKWVVTVENEKDVHKTVIHSP